MAKCLYHQWITVLTGSYGYVEGTKKGDEFTFIVEFNNPDGNLFVRGPCCGTTETEQPPVSKFEFAVQKMMDGQFKVMTPPVYVP